MKNTSHLPSYKHEGLRKSSTYSWTWNKVKVSG